MIIDVTDARTSSALHRPSQRRSIIWCNPTPVTGSSSFRTSLPGGLDAFVDTVVPLLQERGVFRADYQGTTLQ